MRELASYFMIFIFYSFIGWIIDCVDVYIEDGKLLNRGFLIGPYCPVYGFGSILIIIFLTRYKKDILAFLIMAMVICSVLEYFTSWLMEKLFNARWWDYSNKRFNLNGRVCLANIVGFGLGATFIIYFIQPVYSKLITSMPIIVLYIVSLTLFIIFTVDFIVSFNIINKFRTVAKSVHKDNTEEITKKVRNTLYKQGGLYRRLVSVFNFEASENLLITIKSKVKNQTLKAKKRFEIEKQKIKLLNQKRRLEYRIKEIDEEIKETSKK